MDDKTYNTWDVVVKIFGFLATAASIYIGITQFNNQQKAASDLELNKNFWNTQNQVYTEVCKNVGSMAANVNSPKTFEQEKIKFLSNYYGQMVLVEDPKVDSNMREIKSFIEVFVPSDPNMVLSFKRKVLHLSDACKNSSLTFKRANLK